VVVPLLVLAAAAIAVLLHSHRFHRYILAKAQSTVTESLNTRVDLQDFTLQFAPLGVDVYGVTIHGAAPYADTPVLQMQHAHVGVRVVSFLQRKWYLSDVQLDHPVVQVFVDKNGASNLPKPTPDSSRSNTTIWDLGIRHSLLNQGEIHYNEKSAPLSADLHDVDLRAAFNDLLNVYSGDLKYNEGHVIFGAYQPFVHNFDAQFELTPTTFELRRAQLTSNAAQVDLVANVTNFGAPHVQAKYNIKIDGNQLAKLINISSLPRGLVQATGSAAYQQVANQPALNSLTVIGDLSSKQLVISTPSLHAAIDNIAAHYSLTNGDVVLHDLRARLLAGVYCDCGKDTCKRF
jgi:translocation and assembly module TamB